MAYALKAPIAAGTWHLVGDGEYITKMVDVRFDIIWRDGAKTDTVLASAMHTFAPPSGGGYGAVSYEEDVTGIAADAKAGDQLFLKFNVTGGATGATYTPNGDGTVSKGRWPNLTLP